MVQPRSLTMHTKPILFLAFALASGAAFAQHSGTVESVQKVERTERTQGIAGTRVTPGMALGGVVGGVLGNQIGSGSGRGAATVLGAAGGAYAGHQIERHNRRYVAYVMKIRMDGGGWRTVEQRTPIARGSHVIVEGRTARLERAPRHG
jgi:outer membrane lipoprotein SlyB